MKKIIILIAAISLIGFASGLSAQPGMVRKGGDGWGPHTNYHRMYDPDTIENISGKVIAIDRITPITGMGYGVHLMVETDQEETLSVHLGPAWYVENQDVEIEPNDELEIKGSRVMFDDTPTIIAAEVKKGDDILILRDEKGFPAWSGWRRR
jgi:hypothetical protein